MSTSNSKHFFLSRWFLIGAFVLACLIGFAFFRAYYREYEVNKEISRLQEEVHKLETKKIESLELLKYVQSDAFVEEKARTEFNMAKPGEKAAVIGISAPPKESGQENIAVVKWNNLKNPIKWFKYFLHQDY